MTPSRPSLFRILFFASAIFLFACGGESTASDVQTDEGANLDASAVVDVQDTTDSGPDSDPDVAPDVASDGSGDLDPGAPDLPLDMGAPDLSLDTGEVGDQGEDTTPDVSDSETPDAQDILDAQPDQWADIEIPDCPGDTTYNPDTEQCECTGDLLWGLGQSGCVF